MDTGTGVVEVVANWMLQKRSMQVQDMDKKYYNWQIKGKTWGNYSGIWQNSWDKIR